MVYCSIKSWRIVRGVANRKISTWVTKFVHWRFFTYFSAKLERIFHLTCTNFRVNNENSKEVFDYGSLRTGIRICSYRRSTAGYRTACERFPERQPMPDFTRGYGVWQDFYNGKCYQGIK